jgi:putative acetyltransferase
MKKIDAAACEMKRMFVYPAFHGRGVGTVLGQAVAEAARLAGYRVMRLGTSIHQRAAQALCARLGFRVIEPYNELPEDLRSWLVFMELSLPPLVPEPPRQAHCRPIARAIDALPAPICAAPAATA